MTIDSDKQLAICFITSAEATLSLESDTYALLLKDDILVNEEDFIFYGSKNRNEPYNKEIHRSPLHWRNSTFPLSLDGSVKLEMDHSEGYYHYHEDDGEVLSELCIVNLQLVSTIYNKIVIGLALYGDGAEFGQCNEVVADVLDMQSHEIITRMHTQISESSHSAIECLILTRNQDDSWNLASGSRTFRNGLHGVIDHINDQLTEQ